MTVTPQPGSAPPEGDARAGVVSQYMDAGMFAACHPDAEVPVDVVLPLNVPSRVLTFGMACLWLEGVAEGWGTEVTEDEGGARHAEKRFGGLRWTAAVKPGDYSGEADRAAYAAYLEALA